MTVASLTRRLLIALFLVSLCFAILQRASGQEPMKMAAATTIPSAELYRLIVMQDEHGSSHPSVKSLRRSLEKQLAVEDEYLKRLLQSMNRLQRNMIDEQQKTESSYGDVLKIARNLETLEQLAQNCMVEGQRLEWEIAAGEVLAQHETKEQELETDHELKSIQEQIILARSKLLAASKDLEAMKPLAGKTIANTDLRLAEQDVERKNAEVEFLSNRLKKINESQSKRPATSHATAMIKSLLARKELVQKQLADLNKTIDLARRGRQVQQSMDDQAATSKMLATKRIQVEQDILINDTVRSMFQSLVPTKEAESDKK